MGIAQIMKDGLGVLRNNPVILLPSAVLSLVMSLLAALLVESGLIAIPTVDEAFSGTMTSGVLALTLLGMMLGLFVHGMTLGMARDAVAGGRASLRGGLETAADRFYPLTIALLLGGALVFAGSLFFVVPGLLAAFLLMFTFVAIVADNAGPLPGMRRSLDTVKAHMGEALLLFLCLLLSALIFVVIDIALSLIPVIGQLLDILLSGVMAGYISIVLVLAYGRMRPAAVSQ